MPLAARILLGIVLVIAGAIAFGASLHDPTPLRFEIADTPEERAQGLSGRQSIPDNYAMLFVYEEADLHGFWMKDMFVPIDIIWLGDDGTVLKIEEAVSPDTYPKVFYPPQPVRYVLEMRAGQGKTLDPVVELPL